MKVLPTPIEGAWIVETMEVKDSRGSFYRAFCDYDLRSFLEHRVIQQANISRTERVGAIRGLHYQRLPFIEMKLVRCLRGRVWDVVLDLRPLSKTYRQWHAEELSAADARMMVIPEGCAHGFQVLREGSELLYLHTALYTPESEIGVRFDDPAFGINWPLSITDVSRRDMSHPLW